MEVQGISLLISTSWKRVIIKGKVWGATQSVLIDLWQWCNKRKRTRESSVLEHTQNMICFSTCSSDPAHFGTPAGSSNSPVKPIESRQEGVRSLKMLPCELSSREIILREMHIKHYQDGCLILQGVSYSWNKQTISLYKGAQHFETTGKYFYFYNLLFINLFLKHFVLNCIDWFIYIGKFNLNFDVSYYLAFPFCFIDSSN